MALEDDILELLARQPGLKGREVAARIGRERGLINSTLTTMRRNNLAWQDRGYRWFPQPPNATRRPATRTNVDTPLSKLCGYYLQCLSLDENGVSLFARTRYAPTYIELPVFPELDPMERPISSFAGVGDLFQRLRRGASRQIPYLGYPVRVRRFRKETGEEYYFVEPLLLFEFADDTLPAGAEPNLAGELPTLNFRALRSLAMGDPSQIMDEAARLAEELGLSEADAPELDDVVARLVEVRPDWDWKEEIDPTCLSSQPPLPDINEEGIFNRAIVFGTERPIYTKGLEQELAKLQSVPVETHSPTALGAWLSRDFSAYRAPVIQDSELLEPLPLNSEERESVEKALCRPLTVITGPPGTGKSQVVSTLLVNAAKRGLRVLFASKNNKAVDVVEVRVNALGPRPILLRLGRGEYQASLMQYLTALLASRSSRADSERYRQAAEEYSRLNSNVRELQARAHTVVDLRNAVRLAEQKIEVIRQELGENKFKQFRSLDANSLRAQADMLSRSARRADRDKQRVFSRLFWFALQGSRLEVLRHAVDSSRTSLESVGIAPSQAPTSSTDAESWLQTAEELAHRAELVTAAFNYFALVERLTAGDRLEDLSRKLLRAKADSTTTSLSVWEAWLRLAPSRLSSEDRHTLGEFTTVLRLIAESDENRQRAGRQVFARYYSLFPRLVNQLPCWAVTSLSARGRIPLEPGFFDLLVVDEASQCDIASLLPLLFRAKAAAIIGDPMQLRHISAIPLRRDRNLLQQNGLVESYLNWAFSENSVFDLASPLASADDIVMLRDHHRSHADIIGFSNEHFYSGQLRIATHYDRLRRLSNGPAVRWINVPGHVTRPGSSALNEVEAQAVVKELERMVLNQGYRGTVGVVTPFRAQVNRIRDLLHAHPQAHLLLESGEMLVDTVYCFQGDERDVIIFSPVVSSGISNGALHWLEKTSNQFNVAVTRARAALVVVGDLIAATNSGIGHLSGFARYVERINEQTAEQAAPQANNCDWGPRYPTVARPEEVSDWEKSLYVNLYNAGLRPIPQYNVEKFRLDLALISGERRLDIEVDGEHHRDWTGELLHRDQLRNMRLVELGWDVIRFWVYELRENMAACVDRVAQWTRR